MPAWLEKRKEYLMKKNPDMSESAAYGIATKQMYAAGKAPKGYGTAEGRRAARETYSKPKSEYRKTAADLRAKLVCCTMAKRAETVTPMSGGVSTNPSRSIAGRQPNVATSSVSMQKAAVLRAMLARQALEKDAGFFGRVFGTAAGETGEQVGKNLLKKLPETLPKPRASGFHEAITPESLARFRAGKSGPQASTVAAGPPPTGPNAVPPKPSTGNMPSGVAKMQEGGTIPEAWRTKGLTPDDLDTGPVFGTRVPQTEPNPAVVEGKKTRREALWRQRADQADTAVESVGTERDVMHNMLERMSDEGATTNQMLAAMRYRAVPGYQVRARLGD
jgi:hypothetical protein